MIVKNNNWSSKLQQSFFNNLVDGRLPNVLFDVTGDKSNKLIKHAKTTREMGYNTALVWVVTNREEAMIRNLCRSRSVSDTIMHTKHNEINSNLYQFIKGDAGRYFDECWVVFGSNSHAGGTESENEWLAKNRVIQFKKQGSSFVPTNKEAARIFMTLGGEEPNPENPVRYKDSAYVKDMIKLKGVTSKTSPDTDWGDISFKNY